MKNRIPPNRDWQVTGRPAITDSNLVLTVDLIGFLVFQWVTPNGIFHQTKYHVDTDMRVGWTSAINPIGE